MQKIYAQLGKFKELDLRLSKDATNPHFKSKYTTLGEVKRVVDAPLLELGMLFLDTSNEKGVTTTLLHFESGEKIESFFPYKDGDDAQKKGAAITYARRYNRVAILDLIQEDDDGNQATGKTIPVSNVEAMKQEYEAKIKALEARENVAKSLAKEASIEAFESRVKAAKEKNIFDKYKDIFEANYQRLGIVKVLDDGTCLNEQRLSDLYESEIK